MQIGKRWSVGDEAPQSLPLALRQAIAQEEGVLDELGADTTGWGWTLTYLEGEPVVTLDDGTVISIVDGTVEVTHED